MTITFVAHLTPEPALYGALAAILAELRALPLLHLPVSHDEARFPGGRGHITAQGQRVSSGLLWVERLTGRDAGPETPWEKVRARALTEDLVVPVNPALLPQLAAAGLQVAATLDDHDCAAVTLADHPFFTGLAGRPEPASRRERPQPLLMAFLQQVRQSKRTRALSHAALTTSAPPAHPHFLRG